LGGYDFKAMAKENFSHGYVAGNLSFAPVSDAASNQPVRMTVVECLAHLFCSKSGASPR
jgi:hypothetical protein